MKNRSIWRSHDKRRAPSWRIGMSALAISAAIAAYGAFGRPSGVLSAQNDMPLKALGTVSGTVTAPKPFKAAHVYLNNLDKHITYMVYTSGGAFRAVALFPGNYEVVVKGRGLESDSQKIVVKAGENRAVKVAMRNAADP